MHLQIQGGFSIQHIRQTNSLNLLTPSFLPLDWVKSGWKKPSEIFRQTGASVRNYVNKKNMEVEDIEQDQFGCLRGWEVCKMYKVGHHTESVEECQNHSMGIRRCEKVKRDVTRWLSARDWPEDLCCLQMHASLKRVCGVLNSGGCCFKIYQKQ